MSTALITGASVGLGEQFARRFAQDGHDVILVARNEARLEAVAERVRQAGKVKAYVMPFDLADAHAPQALHDAVLGKGLTVDFLVNNAGFGSTGDFLSQDLAREAEMVQVNCSALLQLTHLFARGMKARGTGRILNIASTAAFQPGPFMATYFATKAFVVSFSEALAHELQRSGVTVTCYCPGATATEFAGRAGNDKTRLFQNQAVARAEDVVAEAYDTMMEGEVLGVHGLLNWLAMQSVRLSPRAVVRAIAAGLNSPPADD
jgi:hypothetical protein